MKTKKNQFDVNGDHFTKWQPVFINNVIYVGNVTGM